MPKLNGEMLVTSLQCVTVNNCIQNCSVHGLLYTRVILGNFCGNDEENNHSERDKGIYWDCEEAAY